MIIYKTTNKINGKIYIGQDKNNNPDYLGSGKIIRQSIEKYGAENFEKEILEECTTKEQLDLSEIYWIAYYNSTNREIGYNIAKGGTGGDTISKHPDKNLISKKISKSNKGRKPWNTGTKGKIIWTEESKRKNRESNLGKRLSEEAKKKISIAKKKWWKNLSPEEREYESKRRSEKMKGRKMPPKTEEQRKKHSEWMKENNPMFWYNHTRETREKIRLANLGKPKSEEHRKKLREANKGNKPPNMKKVEIDGIVYESITEASRITGINMSTLRNRINSKNYEGYKRL